ncbi:MAG: MlaD family protein [Acidobacteriota bacterium]
MRNTILVGLFTVLSLAALAMLVLRIEDWNPFAPEGQRVVAEFDSVVGLDDRAPVRVAGVRVGRVDGVSLSADGRRAQVQLLLETPVPLTEGSRARIANTGLLGDKYVELVPGPSSAPALGADAVLSGEVPVSIDDALARIDDLGSSLQTIAGDLAERDIGASIARLLDNLEATSEQIRLLVEQNGDQVSATVDNFERFSGTLAAELPALSEQIRALLTEVDGVIDDNRDELGESIANIREITERVQTSVDNLNDISTQIASGEGTLGKLIYSSDAHDGLVSTLDSVESGVNKLGETLGRVDAIKLDLQLEGSYFTDLEDARTAFLLDLTPGEESRRFYRIGVVDDPRGRRRTKTDTFVTTRPDGTVETETVERTTLEDDFALSAQLGYKLRDDLVVRAGIFESSGGAAVDYALFRNRLWLTLEAFDFDRPDDLDPHLRVTARWWPTSYFFVSGGYDDFLIDDQDNFFIGAGLRWRDDDLKYLLGSVPTGGF